MSILKASEKEKMEIHSVLEEIATAFEERDLNRMMSLFSPGDDLVVIGTGADELQVGTNNVRSLFKRDWAQSEAS